jgi:predicted GIY-YIG superfamily endonuclease
MITVYVIESLAETWYTGIAIDPINRLHERQREKYLKSAAGKRWLDDGS